MIDLEGSERGAHILDLARAEDDDRAFVVSTYDVLGGGLESILVRAATGPEVAAWRRGVVLRFRERLGHEVEVALNRDDARWLAEAIAAELANLDEPD